jgi:hypothetical protein
MPGIVGSLPRVGSDIGIGRLFGAAWMARWYHRRPPLGLQQSDDE